jgi:hypothetical protein
MEYDKLYDESPYTSKEVRPRGGIMNTIRATFWICTTILVSVIAVTYYSFEQDQFVVTSSGNFVSIFDKKSRTINVCDKGNCNLITPTFTTPAMMAQAANAQPGLLAQAGQRLLGSFPQPQGPGNPQQPQLVGGNPQMNPQMMQEMQRRRMMPQQMGGQQMNPQMNPQMMQEMERRRMMQQQMGGQQMNPQMNPQMMQEMERRRMMQQQQMNPQMMQQQQMNPQMMQEMQRRRMMQQQQMAGGNPQQMNPQMISGVPGAQAQLTAGAQVAAPADKAADDTAAADDTKTDDTAADDTKTDDTKADDTAAPEEEAAPV